MGPAAVLEEKQVLDVLVVEDDADDFYLVADLLRSELSGTAQQATSVDDALQRLAGSRYDVILLDYTLGARNGLDLLAELRERGNTTPVIFLTGHGGEEIAVRALKGGAVDYLPKAKMNAGTLGTAVRYAIALREKDAAVCEAREALVLREREYRMLFEDANDAILIIDPDTEAILTANPAAFRLYRCTREQLIGHSLVELSTDPVHGRDAIHACLRTGRLKNFETVHFAIDGTPIHILANASVVEYRGARALLAVFRDISERKAAEQEIYRLNRALKALSKCSEALLHAREPQQLLNEICNVVVQEGGYRMAWVASAPSHSGDRIRPLAGAGTGLEYLETVCRRYGESTGSVLLVPTAMRTGAPAVCRDTSSDPRSSALVKECEERGFASILALPLRVEERIAGALAIYAGERDAFDSPEVALLLELAANVSYGLESLQARHEKEVAQEKLAASEQRYRTLFERNLAGVFRARADGALVEANEAFVRMLGYDAAAELAGLKLPELCAASGSVEPCFGEVAECGQVVNREIRILRKDGATACLLANLVCLRDAAGAPEFIEGTVLDITQRRQLEAQLLHSQKMDAIGQLAGGIAHDFNNLLMVIRSYAELAGESPHPVQRELDAILKAADRGAALTRQLLTFGRKQVFSPRLLDINSALDAIIKVLPRALGEDIRVELHPAKDLWQVKADPVQIEQLVLNLAVNARDAMPEGGRLTLETSNEVLDPDYVKLHAGVVAGEYVMLSVSDTGQGIPPEVMPRIFEPFFTTKDTGKGTGLGLPTVYGIVQQSGGFVWVYSEVGQGTVFKVYLPRAGAARSREDAVAPATETPVNGVETILLVEDEEAVRGAARDYLSRRGYRILEAGSGEEALRLSDSYEGTIDLVITDAVMPGMKGNVLGQKIVERRPGVRLIYVSGYTEATIGEHGVGREAVFLQKPFSLSVLTRKVRQMLDARPNKEAAA